MLEQLGFGDYIEIINRCKTKMQLTQTELTFINNSFKERLFKILHVADTLCCVAEINTIL